MNSGTEANEAALKFARAHTGRKKFVAAMRGFSGRTMGSLSVTWEPKYREPFLPLVEPVEFIPYNDVEALKRAVDEETAAVILEPVQGEGGGAPGDPRVPKGRPGDHPGEGGPPHPGRDPDRNGPHGEALRL